MYPFTIVLLPLCRCCDSLFLIVFVFLLFSYSRCRSFLLETAFGARSTVVSERPRSGARGGPFRLHRGKRRPPFSGASVLVSPSLLSRGSVSIFFRPAAPPWRGLVAFPLHHPDAASPWGPSLRCRVAWPLVRDAGFAPL